MKKLLLILLCLPTIGFGQDDKIIFISGDMQSATSNAQSPVSIA